MPVGHTSPICAICATILNLFDPFILRLGPFRPSIEIEGGAIPLPDVPSTRPPRFMRSLHFALELAPLFQKMEGEATSYRDIYASICSETHLDREVITEIQKAKIAKNAQKKKPSYRGVYFLGPFLVATLPSSPGNPFRLGP